MESQGFLGEHVKSTNTGLARSVPGMMLYACVGIGLTGTKGGRFALITESIAAVGSSDLIDEAVSVGVETGSSCLLCAT